MRCAMRHKLCLPLYFGYHTGKPFRKNGPEINLAEILKYTHRYRYRWKYLILTKQISGHTSVLQTIKPFFAEWTQIPSKNGNSTTLSKNQNRNKAASKNEAALCLCHEKYVLLKNLLSL